MVIDTTFFLLAVPAVLFAGVAKGGFAGGPSFAAAPFLALILAPGEAIGLMLPLLMLMDVGALRPYWGKWDLRVSRILLLGSVPGLVAGILLYRVADPDLFRLMIGVIAIGFVAFQVARGRGWIRAAARPMGDGGGLFWGAMTGLTSFISHAGGPPSAVYMLSQNLTKTTFQATTVLVFWALNLSKFVPYFWLGIFTPQTMLADLYLAPVALGGVWLGVWLHRLVPETLFFRLAYTFLLLTGAKLILDALT